MIRVAAFVGSSILRVLGLAILASGLVGVLYSETSIATSLIILSSIYTILGYLGAKYLRPDKQLTITQGFAAVGLSWLSLTLAGIVPYLISLPEMSFTDALFETASGFSTTGSSVIINPSELPKAIIFWRSITQWVGGMGIIILTISVMPLLGSGGLNLAKAESPGPNPDRLTPLFKDTAVILWGVYLVFTLAQTLLLFFSGLDIFSALNHSFTTLSTGGFSTFDTSVSSLSNSTKLILCLFMFIAGTSFTLHYKSRRNLKEYLYSSEFKFFTFIVFFSASIFYIFLNTSGKDSITSIIESLFTSLAIITTTGYSSSNFELWPGGLKILILGLMFVGGMSGSTGGGIKVVRVVALLKTVRNELKKLIFPKAIFKVRMSKSAMTEQSLESVQTFFILYITVFGIGSVLLGLTSYFGGISLSIETILSSVASALNNIGPALDQAGPFDTYFFFDNYSKILLAFIMLVGRLELFPIAILFNAKTWK